MRFQETVATRKTNTRYYYIMLYFMIKASKGLIKKNDHNI